MTSRPTLCCVAGRSGGHIIPCMTRAQQEAPDHDILFFTTNHPLDTQIIRNYHQVTHHLPLPLMNVPRWWWMPLFVTQAMYCFFKSFWTLLRNRPSKIVTTGGYIAIPVCLAGFILRIPIELYELNAVPGKAAYWLAPFATHIFVCFKRTQQYFKQPTHIRSYPVRFTHETAAINPTDLMPGYDRAKKTILILGGSQGSDFLNQQLCHLVTLAGNNIQIIHQTGAAHVDLLKKFYEQQQVCNAVFAYHQDLYKYYQLSDVIICRAGAGSLFETLFFKKPCITIPLETASTNHQLNNAYALRDEHPELVTVLRQQELQNDPACLFKTVSNQLDLPRA